MPRNVSKADKTVRCIALLLALSRARRGVQLRPLFEGRGWCWRSAYRDLETLRRAGVPVETRERGWFRLADGWIPAGPVDVKRDELAALFAARRLAPALGDLDALWSKLSNPNQLALNFECWLNTRRPAIDYGPHRRALAMIQRAIRERLVLQLRYRKPMNEETTRLVEPAFVRWEPTTEAFYLIAWCRTRGAIRTFAVHRIVVAEPTAETFATRRDATEEMSKAFRLWAGRSSEHVSLSFSPRVAHEVRERCWHPSEVVSETPDGGMRVEMDVAVPEELERLILGYGSDVVVDAPARLAIRIREVHAACAGIDRLDMRRPPVRGSAQRRRVDTL